MTEKQESYDEFTLRKLTELDVYTTECLREFTEWEKKRAIERRKANGGE